MVKKPTKEEFEREQKALARETHEYRMSFYQHSSRLTQDYKRYVNSKIRIELQQGCTIDEARQALRNYEALLNTVEEQMKAKHGPRFIDPISQQRNTPFGFSPEQGPRRLQKTDTESDI